MGEKFTANLPPNSRSKGKTTTLLFLGVLRPNDEIALQTD